MSRRPFRADEIRDGVTDAAGAAAIGRRLERYAAAVDGEAPDGLADLVMTAIVTEPAPSPARALEVAVRAGRVRAAFTALGDAWRVAMGGGRPVAARVSALALVVVLMIGVGSAGGVAAVGAWNALHPMSAPVVVPSSSPPPSIVAPSPSVHPSPTPTDSDDDGGPGASDDHDTDTDSAH